VVACGGAPAEAPSLSHALGGSGDEGGDGDTGGSSVRHDSCTGAEFEITAADGAVIAVSCRFLLPLHVLLYMISGSWAQGSVIGVGN